ncbi:PilW family protein [Dasania marina]|uniref:PilW family protein n=1 Tax=Dasania marina TaxID=471499 RepID=UPI0004AE30D1|nr:PilW family protein [Dasania marina]
MMSVSAATAKGFSLVELLVAMALSSVLLGGIIQVFIGSKQAYSFNEELGWIQENSRFAVEFMSRDLRMAGYWGCNKDIPVVDTLNPIGGTGWQGAFGNGLGGFNGDDTGNAAFTTSEFPQPTPPVVASGTVPRSDVLTLSRLDSSQSFSVTAHNPASAVMTIGSHPFNDGDILVVSDCGHSAIFQHAGSNPGKVVHNTGTGTPGNSTNALGTPLGTSYTYGNNGPASVMRAMSSAYYVDVASNGLPALFVRSLANNAATTSSELIQGIENLQVLYGEDLTADGSPNRYVDASNVGVWTNVTAVKIHLLARSLQTVASEPQDFSFMGVTYTPTDRFLRQEFVSTVKIRNR